jgi:AbrB family looped-hinge helix DNA binding protein
MSIWNKSRQRRQDEMAVVKVKRFAQVTLPADLRKRFNLAEGDYLEAQAVNEGILLKPVTLMERDQAWKKVFAAIKSVKDRKSKPNQSPKEQEEEIAREVKAFRREHAAGRS